MRTVSLLSCCCHGHALQAPGGWSPTCWMGTRLWGQAISGSPLQRPGIWSQAVCGPWACFPQAVGFRGRPRQGMACDLQGVAGRAVGSHLLASHWQALCPTPSPCLWLSRGTNPGALSLAPSPNHQASFTGTGLSPCHCHPEEQGRRKGIHAQKYTQNLFLGAFPPAQGYGRWRGSHLGFCEHLPALQLAHLDQGSHHAHVRAGSSSNLVAVSCGGGEGGMRHSEACPCPLRALGCDAKDAPPSSD